VIPLILFLAAMGSLLLAPAGNLISRRIEARADVHSLDVTRDVPTFVASEQRLARTNLSDLDPNPFLYAMFSTHPTSPQRIALAREWARLHP
jgi:STE24 endopeptidase